MEPTMIKTNAARVLDNLGIRYELREYQVVPDDLSAGTVVAKIGIPPGQLFKTLAVQGDRNRIYLAAIPATEELDFKALARLTGDRKVGMVPLKACNAGPSPLLGLVSTPDKRFPNRMQLLKNLRRSRLTTNRSQAKNGGDSLPSHTPIRLPVKFLEIQLHGRHGLLLQYEIANGQFHAVGLD
jgi:hypothetical protein